MNEDEEEIRQQGKRREATTQNIVDLQTIITKDGKSISKIKLKLSQHDDKANLVCRAENEELKKLYALSGHAQLPVTRGEEEAAPSFVGQPTIYRESKSLYIEDNKILLVNCKYIGGNIKYLSKMYILMNSR